MQIDHDAGYSVTRTARAFMRVAEARLKPLGIGVAYLPVLVDLSEEGRLTRAEIAQRAHVEQPTAAGLLKRMAAADLLVKSPAEHDRRATYLALSLHARHIMPQALDALSEVNEQATAGLSAEEAATLRHLLDRVLTNLDGVIAVQRR